MSRAGDLRNITATATSSEDNYVLTYDDATKKVSLEAAAGGNNMTQDLTIQTSTGAVLKLQTSDTSVVDGDTIGAIEFKAPNESSGGDAIENVAEIVAEADTNFSSIFNITDLVFKTGYSTPAQEWMRLRGGGDLEVIGNSGATLRLQTTETQVPIGHQLGAIEFQAPDESSGGAANNVAVKIWARSDASFSASNNNTDLIFAFGQSGSITERLRIEHEGNLRFPGTGILKAANGNLGLDSVGGNVMISGDTGNMEFTNTGTGVFTFGGTIQGASNAEIKTSPIRIHSNTISTNTTVASNENAVSGGPVTIASGVTVTVSGDWTVV